MIRLSDGLYLYHGSYVPVENINLKRCVPHKDFGRGFYVTSSLKQAENFVHLSLNRAKLKRQISSEVTKGYVSVFQFECRSDLRIKYFTKADIEWLHFVIANRDHSFFPNLIKTYSAYNVFAGKIANDRTAATLQAYMENIYGEVGTQEADERAIATLLPNKLEDQICFKSEEAISSLHFIRSICCEQ